MYDLDEANKIYKEMMENDKTFADKLVKQWRDKMPTQFAKTMYQEKYGCHITTEDMYEKGLSYIVDYKGNNIVPWAMGDILKIAKEYVDIDDEKFSNYDLALWSNVKKGDYGHIISDSSKIIRIAIADLTDRDYFCDPSERAYKWVEKHMEKEYEEEKY